MSDSGVHYLDMARPLVLALAVVAALTGVARAKDPPASPIEIDPGVRVLPLCGSLTAVAFRTELDGFVIDDCGKIFRTRDNGLGWSEDEETQFAIYGSRRRANDYSDRDLGIARYIHWWTSNDGLVGVIRGAFFVTSDGGSTWTRVPTDVSDYLGPVAVTEDSLFVCGHGGRVVKGNERGRRWTTFPSAFDLRSTCVGLDVAADGSVTVLALSGKRWVTRDEGITWTTLPGLSSNPVPRSPGCPGRRGDEVIRCGGSDLVFERPGQAPRRSPIVSAPSGHRVPLLGTARTRYGWYGWTEEHLLYSKDGSAWAVKLDLPAKPGRVTFLPTADPVFEAEDGRVFRRNGATGWWPSSSPMFDRADADQQRTGKPGPSPFACLVGAQKGHLEIRRETGGCYEGVGPYRLFAIGLEPSSVEATFLQDKTERTVPLERALALDIIEAIWGAVAPLETPGSCMSTAWLRVEVAWSCDGKEGEPLAFSRDICLEEFVKEDGYSRALALEKVISEAAKTAF